MKILNYLTLATRKVNDIEIYVEADIICLADRPSLPSSHTCIRGS